MKRLIIATKNKKKLKELKKLLRGLRLNILCLGQLSKKTPKIKEDKDTFTGNAKKKALVISRLFKDALILADDSGLVVRSLNGAPGVKSARYGGLMQDDDKNISKLLKNLDKKKDKSAYFICVAVVAENGKVAGIARGRVYGRIINKKLGNNGFGYDPVFIPKGYKKTFAQMRPAFKNKISHRARALKKAKEIIQICSQEHP